MLSTLFAPDPTLTVDNVSCVMEKVEPKVKMQVWNDVLEHRRIEFNMFVEKFSFKEEECADIYVNCCHSASWEGLAQSLYRHHQVAAVEDVRTYLPPRGEQHFGIYNRLYLSRTHVQGAIDLYIFCYYYCRHYWHENHQISHSRHLCVL